MAEEKKKSKQELVKEHGRFLRGSIGKMLGNRLNFIYKDMVPLQGTVKELIPLLVYFQSDRHPEECLGDFCHRKGLEELLRFDTEFSAQREEVTVKI